MTIAWSALYDEVLSELPKCPTNLADIAIKRAAVQFHEESSYLARDADAVDITAGTHTYQLLQRTLDGTVVVPHACLAVRISDGEPLDQLTDSQLDDRLPGWRSMSGQAFAYLQEAPGSVRIVRTPDADLEGALVLKIAYKPDFALATGMHDSLGRWQEDICKGAKSRLMLMTGKPWQNAVDGVRYRVEFEQAIGDAKLELAKGFGRAKLRTKPV